MDLSCIANNVVYKQYQSVIYMDKIDLKVLESNSIWKN
jgi:hypothetical protein